MQLAQPGVIRGACGHLLVQRALALGVPVERTLEALDLLSRGVQRCARGSAGPGPYEHRYGRGAVQLEVLVDPARQVTDPAVACEREDVIADPFDEVPVVAHDHERARPAVEQVLEGRERVDVEVVGRLVEHEDVGFRDQQAHELEPSPFPAGELAHQRARAVSAEAEAIAQHPGRDLLAIAKRGAPAYRLQRLQYPLLAGDLDGVLREAGEPHGGAALDRPRGRREIAAEEPQQGRLSRSVDADEGNAIAWPQPPGHPVEHVVAAEGERDLDRLEDRIPEAGGGEAKQFGPVAYLRLVGDQGVRGGDAKLRFGGPGGRAASQPCELLAQELTTPILSRRLLAVALGAGQYVCRVATLITVDARVRDLPGSGADGVEEPAVVGHDEHRPATPREMPTTRSPRRRGGSSVHRGAAAPVR